eukprot:15238710-Heterocapsa_arctica.AAC.1
MRNEIKTERTKIWRAWVEKWIRGKKGQGQLIVLPGGSAQMNDILKVAEEAWGGLWVVDAEDLPQFENEGMEPRTADGIIRVVHRLVDGKAEGVYGWSPAELRALSQTHTQGLADILNKVGK